MKRHLLVRLLMAALVSITAILPQTVAPAAAASERALYLYYTHTKETARIVFKRNGQYVQSGLNELNVFLRDWRRNEPAKMDPRLFDLVWEVYQEVGATQPVNVVSAYRSPQTNAMLAKNSSGVADNSQHMRGTAMDFFIPGVSLSKLRAVAMRKQFGGVGYYPTSGSPFVHLDVGSVRAWPRMTRAQLKEIFPDGRTMHLPTDGTPLSREGYQIAMAGWKQCHRFPCEGGSSGSRVAEGGSGRTLMDMFFGGDEEPAPVQVAAATPAPVQVAAVAPQAATPVPAPMPAMRPAAFGGIMAPVETASAAPTPAPIPFSTTGSAPLDPAELATTTTAPMPAMKSERLRVATASSLPSGDAVTALAAFTAPLPQPRLHMTEQDKPEAMTAYLAPMQATSTQQTLESIIASTGTAAATAPAARLPILPPAAVTELRTASLGGTGAAPAPATDLFSTTFGAAQQNETMAAALAAHMRKQPAATAMRNPSMVAPDFEHVADVFTAPVSVTSDHFATIWDRDQADFDPTAEMGQYTTVMAAGDAPAGLSHTGFAPAKPVALATSAQP